MSGTASGCGGSPMKIYLGVVGSSKVQAFVRGHNLGWLLTPTNSRDPKGISYALDNGAFVAWKNGEGAQLPVTLPGIEAGVRGMRFIERAIESSRKQGWVEF